MLTDPLLAAVEPPETKATVAALANGAPVGAGAAPPSLAAQIKFLALKNLAGSLAAGKATAREALTLYGQAAALDGGDIVLWNRMGALVGAAGFALLMCSFANTVLLRSLAFWCANVSH